MGDHGKALRSGIWYLFAVILVRGISFLTTPLFTRIMSQEEYGLYNNYLSWQSILIILTTFNVKATLISARYEYERDLDKYLFSVLLMSTISTVTWAVFINIYAHLENTLSIGLSYFNLMMLYIAFHTAIELFQDLQRFLYRYKMQVFLSLLISISTVSLSLLFVVNFKNKYFGRVLGAVVPTVLCGIVIYIYFAFRGKCVDIQYWKYAIKICLPYIPHLLSLTVLNSTDRIMITRFCGSAYTALYSVAYQCGYLASTFLTAMNTAYAPWLAEQLQKGDKTNIRKFSKVYIGSFAIITVGAMAIAPEVMLILGGRDYISAKYVMPPIAMGCFCQFIYTMFVNVEQIEKKTIGMAFASVSAALINYVLNLIFIPKFGYVSAAYTTLVGYLWLLVVHMFLVYKMKMSDVYSYAFISFVVVAIGICTLVMSFLYRSDMFRYIFIGLYAILLLLVFICNKNSICRICKMIRYR